MEHLLHYVWKHKILPLKELRTNTGLPVEIIDPGLTNRDAGPDFFNAKVKIDGTVWIGNVEIHNSSSDWVKHGHHTNKAYDSVILHVAENIDCDVFRTDGEPIPQVQLVCPNHIKERYGELKHAEMRPPCYSIIPSLSKLNIYSWLTALQVERFEQKAEAISARLKQHEDNWEDVFFITLARNFGFGVNGDAFERWANQLSFRAVDKHRDNLFQVEAMFFGQAGLLEEDLEDEYYRILKKEYAYLCHKFGLKKTDTSSWRFMRLRPGNFPYVRIAQLAYLYHTKEALLSKVIDCETLKEVKSLFVLGTSPYWENHYNFRKPSSDKLKKVGNSSLDLVVINTVVPFLYAYGLHKGNDNLCRRATSFLEELKAENNRITRCWAGAGLEVYNAVDSQALIQLQNEYCDKKKCLYCRFGYEYLRTK